MRAAIEPYRDEAWDAEGDSFALPARAGSAYCVGSAGADGSVLPGGGPPCAAPLAWGAEASPDYARVEGWAVVADLGDRTPAGRQAGLAPGRLLAAYWGGRLWLKLQAGSGEAAPGDGGAGAEQAAEPLPDGGGALGAAGEEGFADNAPARAVCPPFHICPMGSSEAFLRDADGLWRADVAWEPLANFSAHGTAPFIAEDGSVGNDLRITIWVIPVGNILCFYTTASPRLQGGLPAAAADRLAASDFGRAYPAGTSARGGPFSPFWCALLPWEGEGAESRAAEPDGDALAVQAGGCPGSLGLAGICPEDGLGAGAPAAMAPGAFFCARWHSSELCGLYGIVFGQTVAQPFEELSGGLPCLEACKANISGSFSPPWQYETTDEYRFDPWAAEAFGVEMGLCAGHYVCDASLWPAVAGPFETLASLSLPQPKGRTLHLAIGGATAGDALLTASAFAEETGADDDTAAAEPGAGGGPSASGGGGEALPPGEDGGDDDATGWDSIAYTAGKGVAVSAVRTAAGGHVAYRFSIRVQPAAYAAQAELAVSLPLSTANGGSYSYHGQACTMYYGFASSEAGSRATLNFKSSYSYSDADPKACTCTQTVRTPLSAQVSFAPLSVSSDDPLLSCGVLAVRPTGRRVGYLLSTGARQWFRVYSVSAKPGAMRQAVLGRACAALAANPPAAGVFPASITGSAGPIAGPAVSAGAPAIAVANPYADGAPSFAPLAPSLSVATQAAALQAGVSAANASWSYDAADGSIAHAAGSLEGVFDISIHETKR